MKYLLIDGDILVYQASFATEKTKYCVTYAGPGHSLNVATFWDDAKAAKEAQGAVLGASEVWSRKELKPVDEALMICDVMIRDILARYPEHRGRLFLTGVGNFRHQIATRQNYKGNRSGSVPPTHMKAVRAHLQSKWKAEVSQGEEADDLIAIAATENPGSVIASIDKDLMQVPGVHYNFSKKEEITVSKKEAALNFWQQVITGDATDSIPGVDGYGPVKAKKLLEGAKGDFDCWMRILELYAKVYGDLEGIANALECAKLVYLRTQKGARFIAPQTPKEHKDAA